MFRRQLDWAVLWRFLCSRMQLEVTADILVSSATVFNTEECSSSASSVSLTTICVLMIPISSRTVSTTRRFQRSTTVSPICIRYRGAGGGGRDIHPSSHTVESLHSWVSIMERNACEHSTGAGVWLHCAVSSCTHSFRQSSGRMSGCPQAM